MTNWFTVLRAGCKLEGYYIGTTSGYLGLDITYPNVTLDINTKQLTVTVLDWFNDPAILDLTTKTFYLVGRGKA